MFQGKSFFHGLDLLNSLEAENSILRYSLNRATISRDYYKGLLDVAREKVEDEHLSHKSVLKAIQDDLEMARSDAATTEEARKKEIEELKSENKRLKSEKDLELIQAFFSDFAAYLQNFLAADPDYDWSLRFAPSTLGFMVDF